MLYLTCLQHILLKEITHYNIHVYISEYL